MLAFHRCACEDNFDTAAISSVFSFFLWFIMEFSIDPDRPTSARRPAGRCVTHQSGARRRPWACRRRPACGGSSASSTPGSSSAASPICRRSKLGHGLTAFVEVTLDRQSAEALAAFESPRGGRDRRCSSATASRPGPTSCSWSRSPTWRPTTPWCSGSSPSDANVRNVKSFFSVHRAKFETRIVLPAADAPT